MEPTSQLKRLSTDHVLQHDGGSVSDDQSSPKSSSTVGIEGQDCPQAASLEPRPGYGGSVSGPLSVRTIRRSIAGPLKSPCQSPKSGSSSQSSGKRKSSRFNIFSTKEPSSQALREYEGMLKKQQNKGNNRVTAVGMPMTSAARLPAHVPKVNSKWDGLPEAVHRKQDSRKQLKSQKSAGSLGLSVKSSRSSLQSYHTQTSLKSSLWRPKSKGSRSIMNGNEASSIRSSDHSINHSNASTFSSPSMPSLSYSNYDFAISRPHTSDLVSPSYSIPSPPKSSLAIANLSSSQNSPNAAIEDLQFSTSFPFPSHTKSPSASNPAIEDGDNEVASKGLDAGHRGPEPFLHTPSEADSGGSHGFFSRLKKKKSKTFAQRGGGDERLRKIL